MVSGAAASGLDGTTTAFGVGSGEVRSDPAVIKDTQRKSSPARAHSQGEDRPLVFGRKISVSRCCLFAVAVAYSMLPRISSSALRASLAAPGYRISQLLGRAVKLCRNLLRLFRDDG